MRDTDVNVNAINYGDNSRITGDITTAKIFRELISVKKKSAWSLIQENTYMVFDVKTRKVLYEYTVPEFTDFIQSVWFWFIAISILSIFVFLIIVLSSMLSGK